MSSAARSVGTSTACCIVAEIAQAHDGSLGTAHAYIDAVANAGTVLRAEHLILKKPGTGIPAARLSELIGRTLRRALKADQLLQEADIL
jgi:sialic acid synthase SpsE